MRAFLFSTAGRAVFLSVILISICHAEHFRTSVRGTKVDVVDVEDGTLASAEGESAPAFLKRVAVVLRAYTSSTGFEACSEIWTNGVRLAVRATSNSAHVGCVATGLAPADGWTASRESIHSHPAVPRWRANAADVAFSGGEYRVGKWVRGDMGEQFSEDDYAAGPGYLVGGAGLYYQAGKGTARAVP